MIQKSILIGAPFSGSGKTLITLGLMRALSNLGIKIAPAKAGPDYIDVAYLSKASGKKAVNLDGFAFNNDELRGLANRQANNADLLLIEGVMGLFDGGFGANKIVSGSTADLAQKLNSSIVLIIDCSHMAQSIAAMTYGYKNFSAEINVAGVILNKVASIKHEKMLRDALVPVGVEVLGAVYRNDELNIPNRHLGLTLPNEIDGTEILIEKAAKMVATSIDLEKFIALAMPLEKQDYQPKLAPLGQHITIARDDAFVFIYQHQLMGWRKMGAKISFFSPLNNEKPDVSADAIFLPGGYPELHGEKIANADIFKVGMQEAQKRGALIYGECGGFMVLGERLIDQQGMSYEMSGLLPIVSSINQPKRVLGYRHLSHNSPLPFAKNLSGHEFHYSSCSKTKLPTLFGAKDSSGQNLAAMGAVLGNVMGSYAHVISAAFGGQA